jgi:hypothetical protein
MRLSGRVPVEPLDDERLTAIERRVVAGAADAAARGHALGARRRVVARAAVALAMAAAGVIGWALHAPPVRPRADDPPALRAEVSPRRSVLDLGDARIESEPGTGFTVTRPGDGVLVAMTRGKVELEVGKRGARPPLIVRAGDTDVVVVGTHFTVDYGDGTGEVDVRVTEGVVRVVHQQQETRVAAGQAWRTRAGLVAAGGSPEAAAAALAGRDARGSATAAPAAAPVAPELLHDRQIAMAPIAMAPVAVPPVLRDHQAAVPGAPGAAGPGSPARIAPAPPRPTAGAPARPPTEVHVDPHIDLKSTIRVQPVEPALDLGEPVAADAIVRYYDIAAHQSGDDASLAFYSIAAVRHFKLGRNAEALQTLDAYVRRFPGGKEYRAALWLRVRILCLARIDDRCRAAAYTYLHQAPDTPAAHVAELLTQTE